MKALLAIIFLAVIFAMCSCQLKVKKTVKIKVDSIEKPKLMKPMAKADSDRYADSAMTVVEKLTEIKNLMAWFYKQKPDTSHHFALNVPEGPGKNFKYYWVRVGEDTPDHFAAWEHFYVAQKYFTIYYYDVVADSIMTIDQWRKSGKDKWYKKQ